MGGKRLLAYVTGTVDDELLLRRDEGGDGPIRCRERLGGLLKYYHREAG